MKVPLLAICELKFMKFWENVGYLVAFNAVFQLYHVFCGRYSPLSLKIVEKRQQ